jgi:hypothetical protein
MTRSMNYKVLSTGKARLFVSAGCAGAGVLLLAHRPHP